MNIILFGPPGVGKSTVLGVLKTRNFRVIDLEDVYPNRIRFQLPNMVENVILGGADLNPKRNYPNAITVLLFADQIAYDQRRRERDKRLSHKANQAHHLIDDWLTVAYDESIDTTSMSKEQVADIIAEIFVKYESQKVKGND